MRWADSKLAVALLVLILSRSVDRVYYTRITFDYNEFLWYFSNIICSIAYLLNLPFNMLLSAILLSTRYKRSHYMGAVLVLYGALVTMIPVFRGETAANMPDPSVFWILFYIIALLPGVGSNEIGLKDVDLDIWYANAWICTYQLLWGAFTIWTIQLPAFSDPPVSWQEFPSYIALAHNCFLGYPVTFNGSDLPCGNGVFLTFLWYILFNCVYNQIMMYVFKEGSSVLFVVSSAVCLPLTDMMYMVPFLAGPKASQTFTIYDGFALFVLIMGMLVYHSEKEERGDAATQKSPMFLSPSMRKAQLMRRRKARPMTTFRSAVLKYGTAKDTNSVV
ncbi:hypothetical protein B5M09_013426 [Aphanomyces astaci]|uniref:EamA domain-containing protein n=1 Tax=Aphanomyces astaci TaxID=112090 RepID=A0A425DLS2_APHAT|nr:hypothetical protein B5M09_013426 [Aphanomyces astaci]